MISLILAAVISIATPSPSTAPACACCCVRQPKISVFGYIVKYISRERGITYAQAADMLYDLGVRGFDAPVFSNDLDTLVATRLKPINLYYFASFFDAEKSARENAACIDQAVKYGVPRVMTIPPNFTKGGDQEAEMTRIIAAFRTFVAAAKARGVTITIEDFGSTDNPCSYAKYLKRMLDEIPDLKFALDSGNLTYANRGESILDMMDYAKGRIGHVHLKDLTAADPHKYATIGLGVVPNEKVVKATWAAGYDGWYTIENPVGDTYIDMVRQLAVLKVWFAEGTTLANGKK